MAKKLFCPKDGFQLEEIKVGNIKVDRCLNCQGVWFDFKGDELLKILAKGYDNLPEKLKESWEEGGGQLTLTESRNYKCPRCGNELSTYWYLGEKDRTFLVDGCLKGCGVWLDDGELQKAYLFTKPSLLEIEEKEIKEGIFKKLWNFWKEK